MNIAKLLDETAAFEVEFNGHTVHFDAVKSSLTPHFLQNLSNAKDYPKVLSMVLKDWDVTSDDKGTKWPMDEESLSLLPVDFLIAIIDRISESWGGEKKSEKNSANGSAASVN